MAEPKRILILTNDTGFGHRNAANAIAAALSKRRKDECMVEIVNPLDDNHAPAILRDSQTDYDRLVREMPESYKLRYEFGDAPVPNAIIESSITVMLFTIIRDLFDRFQPDVVVATHNMYTAPATAVISIYKLKCPFLVVVTDLTEVHRMWLNTAADLILVPTQQARDQALKLDIPEERVQVTGVPVHPAILEETRQPRAIRQELGWQPDLTTVLVVGSKRVKGLEDVLHVFNHSALPMQMAVIAGGDDSLYQRLQGIDWHGPIYLYNYVGNMPSLLHAADCVVSKAGGLIVTESLACGRPLLMVDVTPGQEEGNANFVVSHQAGLRARKPVEALEHLFHWIIDPAMLTEYQQRARVLGRPRAAFTIADLVMSAAGHKMFSTHHERLQVIPKLLELLASFGIGSEE